MSEPRVTIEMFEVGWQDAAGITHRLGLSRGGVFLACGDWPRPLDGESIGGPVTCMSCLCADGRRPLGTP